MNNPFLYNKVILNRISFFFKLSNYITQKIYNISDIEKKCKNCEFYFGKCICAGNTKLYGLQVDKEFGCDQFELSFIMFGDIIDKINTIRENEKKP